MIGRRSSIARLGLLGGALAAMLLPGCREPPRRQAVRALVREAVVPGYRDAANASQTLTESLRLLAGTPNAPHLAAARAAWRTAALAWRRLLPWRLGSIATSGVLARTGYWPVQPRLIERLIASARPPDADMVEEAGAPARGLFAIEHLLFTDSALAPDAARARQLMSALSQDLQTAARDTAREVEQDLTRPADGLAARPDETINKLVADLFGTVDLLTTARLTGPFESTPTELQAQPPEGQPSGTSHLLTLAVLEGVERLYRVGLAPLVQRPAPALATRVQTAFEHARTDVTAIGTPIEEAARTRRPTLLQAAIATRNLEHALKVDLASALGVTITFRSNDGD